MVHLSEAARNCDFVNKRGSISILHRRWALAVSLVVLVCVCLVPQVQSANESGISNQTSATSVPSGNGSNASSVTANKTLTTSVNGSNAGSGTTNETSTTPAPSRNGSSAGSGRANETLTTSVPSSNGSNATSVPSGNVSKASTSTAASGTTPPPDSSIDELDEDKQEKLKFVFFEFTLSDMTVAKFVGLEDKYRQAVATVAGVEATSVLVTKTVAARTSHAALPPQHHAKVTLRAGLAVGTRVFAPAGGGVEQLSPLSQSALNGALLPVGMAGTISRAVTTGGAAVPCGQETHACSLAATPSLIADPAVANVTGARPEPPKTDMGPCVCDVTWRTCDANCRCDSASLGRDCTIAEEGVFSEEFGVGYSREAAPLEVPMCFSQDTFLKLNTPMRIQNSPMCVSKNNNPATGRFFKETAASVSNDKVRVEFAGVGSGPWVSASTQLSQPYTGAYEVGMHMPVAYGSYTASTVEFFSRARGYLALPYPGASGRCQLGNSVRYWADTPGAMCVEGGAVATMCTSGSALSGNKLVKNLFIAKILPGEEVGEWKEISKWTQVALTVEIVERSQTGKILNVFAPGTPPEPYYEPLTGMCNNVLESMEMTIVIDGNGGIASVAAHARLVHVNVSTPAGDAVGAQILVNQMYSASFVSKSVFDIAGASGVQQADYDKSGNPGYIDGKPLRAGLITNSSNEVRVIQLLRQGMTLPLMAAPNGMCKVCGTGDSVKSWCASPATETETSAFEFSERVPVLFNQDISQGCRLKLNIKQLEEFCSGQVLHPLLTYPESLRFATWGDSDAGNAEEWLPNKDQQQMADTSTNPSAAQGWDPRGHCSNVIDSMHIQVLTAQIGNIRNPQQKIIGSRISYGSSSWLAPQERPDGYYTIRSTVSFLQLPDGGSIEVMPPVPSILPILPDDIFYPFATGSAMSVRPVTFVLKTLMAACIVAIML